MTDSIPASADISFWKRQVYLHGPEWIYYWDRHEQVAVPDGSIGDYAHKLLDRLAEKPCWQASTLGRLSQDLGITAKYVTRPLAVLWRCSLVAVDFSATAEICLKADQLTGRKLPPPATAPAVPEREAKALFEQHGYLCARCGRTSRYGDLIVDHIIPFSLLGGHVSDNWIGLCHRCKEQRPERYDPSFVRFYEKRRLPSGTRFTWAFQHKAGLSYALPEREDAVRSK